MTPRTWLTAALSLLLAAGGCANTGGDDSTVPAERRQVDVLRALPFGDSAIEVVTGVLTDAGVGLHDDGVEVTTGKTVRVTRWQARNLAAEAANGGGVPGTLFKAPKGAPPLSYLVAAWIKSFDSRGARFSRELMGEQDWAKAEQVTFPNLVLTLFLADAVAGTKPPDAPARQGMALAGAVAAGPCTFASTFIQNAIVDVAKVLKVNTDGGGFVGFLGKIWNIAVDLAAAAVTGLVNAVEKVGIDAMADVFGIVATVTQLSSTLVKWRAEIRPEPSHTRFGVDSEVVSGQMQLAIAQHQPPIPEFVLDCAQVAGVDLRNAGSAAGSKVVWQDSSAGPTALARRTGADDMLAQDKTARLRYQTSQESSELAKSPDTETFAYVVRAWVERNDLKKVRELVTKLLFDQIREPVRGIVERLARSLLDEADTELGHLANVTASGRTFVTFHVRAKESPKPGGGGNGNGGGKKAIMPTICPGTDVITRAFPRPVGDGGWEFDGEILPGKVVPGMKTCGYSAPLGPDPGWPNHWPVEQVGLLIGDTVEPMPADARPVSIPGTDGAWFHGPLYVVVGPKTMVVTIQNRVELDQDSVALAVAKAVLGVG